MKDICLVTAIDHVVPHECVAKTIPEMLAETSGRERSLIYYVLLNVGQ